MAKLAGVDGCKTGWITITKDTESKNIHSHIYPDANSLISNLSDFSVIAVDIPIGLTDFGPRTCDLLARKLLKKRISSIFPAPIRPTLNSPSYEQAKFIKQQIDGNGISKQAYAITDKIKQFDDLLTANPELQNIIKEIHPEICFYAWNSGTEIPEYKKTEQGKKLRIQLIEKHFGLGSVSSIRKNYLAKEALDDDIHDAFAALWTAERILKKIASRIPLNDTLDRNGISMNIWF